MKRRRYVVIKEAMLSRVQMFRFGSGDTLVHGKGGNIRIKHGTAITNLLDIEAEAIDNILSNIISKHCYISRLSLL
jgi:hypothetical protein